MANPQIKQILDAVAKASSGVMKSADKAVPTQPQCPTCGQTIDTPSTDIPSAAGNQPSSSEDR